MYAIRSYYVEKSKISELEDKELNEYLFLEGVTLVDGDSARGFGLAEVHTRINQIKGKLRNNFV